VTLITITDSMAFRQRKKGVVKIAAGPGKTCHKMAFAAIGGKISCDMIGICCSLVFFFMAVIAFHTEGLKQ
jgi:hypothetical protein